MLLKFKSIASIAALISAVAVAFSGCDNNKKDLNHIKVGVIIGAEQQIAEIAQKVAKEKYGLEVELVCFNDYVLPNKSLSNGDIDLNIFQHKAYLDQEIKNRGYKLVSVGNTFVYLIAGYSDKIKSIHELKDGAQIALPSDAANLGRSLMLLENLGLIRLQSNTGLFPTVLDITNNPKNLKLVELEALQLPRSLNDQQISLVVMNANYASQIGLTPEKNALFVEDKKSPYVNLIVARANNNKAESVKKFVQSYQSDEVSLAAKKIFNGSAIKGW